MVRRECPDVEGVLVWRRAPWCGGEHHGVEKSTLMWRRASWCGGSALMWRASWCGGERRGVQESALVWRRVPCY